MAARCAKILGTGRRIAFPKLDAYRRIRSSYLERCALECPLSGLVFVEHSIIFAPTGNRGISGLQVLNCTSGTASLTLNWWSTLGSLRARFSAGN